MAVQLSGAVVVALLRDDSTLSTVIFNYVKI